MNVLIIGGAGLIGAGLANVLLDKGHQVLILDNFTSNSSMHADLECKMITGNACSFSTMKSTFASFSPDAIFHFADSPYDKEGTYDMSQEAEVAIAISGNILKCLK